MGPRAPRQRFEDFSVELQCAPDADDKILEGGEQGSLKPSSGGHRVGAGPCFERLP
jgi:hypothetical protein